MEWHPIETRPTQDLDTYLVKTTTGDECIPELILQVSNYMGEMYPDHKLNIIDYDDRVLNATHWCKI